MATVVTSIGGGTSHNEAVAIDSVSGSGPYTVTLTAAVPSSVVVGDAFFDEAATPNKYLITGISGSDLTVVDSTGVGSAPDDSSGSSTPAITRYYNGSTPLADFETDWSDTDLYPGGGTDDAEGWVYNDGDLDSVSLGAGAGQLNSMLLTVAEGERHDGTAGTGARIFGGGLGLQCPGGLNQLFTAEWLEIDGNDGVISVLGFTSSSFTNVATARYIIGHGSTDTDGLLQSATRDSLVHDCILYQCERAGSSHWGCRVDSDRPEGGFLNNTVDKVINNQAGTPTTYGLQQLTNSANSRVRNNIVVGTHSPNGTETSTFDFVYAGASGTLTNNLSEDDSADDQGSNHVISIDPNDLFVNTTDDAEDYHLDTGATDAIDAGVDLGTTPSGVEIDIDGRDRDAQGDTWDIGADEFVSAAGGSPVAILLRRRRSKPHILMAPNIA